MDDAKPVLRRAATQAMTLKGRSLLIISLLLTSMLTACGANEQGDEAAPLGGGAGAANVGGASAAGISSGGDTHAPSACEGPSPATKAASGRLDLPLALKIGGNPAAIDTAAAGSDGRELKLSLFKFFLTQPVLVDAAGNESAGQIVDQDGKPLPFGVQLVDVDDPSTQLWRIAVDVGQYTQLRFGVGIPSSCNSPSTSGSAAPLNPDSEMYWAWGAQFLFIRVEGSTRRTEEAPFEPFFYHVGYDAAFAHISVTGTLNVGGAAQGPTLTLDVGRMLATPDGSLPPSQHTVPEGWVADNLEQNQAFSLQ